MRKRIYSIIGKSNHNDIGSRHYDRFTLIVIMLSLFPLAFKEETPFLILLDQITVRIFIIDYFLRFITADLYFNSSKISSFVRYPFSPMAIIDLLSILPSLPIVNTGFKLLRMLRIIRAARVVRIFRVARYSRSFGIIERVVRKSRSSLISVLFLAVDYTLVSAMVIFNVEPDSFNTFFDAFYWAMMSLTTVGYGDIYPVSTLGRMVTMLSSLFGIAIIALPAGIITAGYMSELEEMNRKIEPDEKDPEQ